MTRTFDPIELEVLWQSLIATVNEQAKALQRAAFSPIVREAGDLANALFDLTDKIVSFEYQDAELQALHRAFSGEMNREVKVIAAWGPMLKVAPALATA